MKKARIDDPGTRHPPAEPNDGNRLAHGLRDLERIGSDADVHRKLRVQIGMGRHRRVWIFQIDHTGHELADQGFFDIFLR